MGLAMILVSFFIDSVISFQVIKIFFTYIKRIVNNQDPIPGGSYLEKCGIRLGYETTRVEILAGNDDDEPLDLEGKLDFRYNGVVFYAAYYF